MDYFGFPPIKECQIEKKNVSKERGYGKNINITQILSDNKTFIYPTNSDDNLEII